jgi:hypothetical protein
MMKFGIPLFRKSTTESGPEFSVTVLSSERLQYKSDGLVLDIKIDVDGEAVSLVYSSLHELNPNLQLTLPQEKKIFNDIVDTLSWGGWTVELIDWL